MPIGPRSRSRTTSTPSSTPSRRPAPPVVLAVHSATRLQRVRRERPCAREDRGDGLRRHGSRKGRPGSRLRGRREADGLGGDRGGGEPDGLSEEQKETFRQRAVPVPGSLIREGVELTNDARRDIPSTLICTGFTAEQYQTYAREHPDWAFLAGIPELRNATWVDLPTSHWPMWSRPKELAQIIGDVAKAHVPAGAR